MGDLRSCHFLCAESGNLHFPIMTECQRSKTGQLTSFRSAYCQIRSGGVRALFCASINTVTNYIEGSNSLNKIEFNFTIRIT